MKFTWDSKKRGGFEEKEMKKGLKVFFVQQISLSTSRYWISFLEIRKIR